MFKKRTNLVAGAVNQHCTMETRDHSKNGVSPKDHTSRVNKLNIL